MTENLPEVIQALTIERLQPYSLQNDAAVNGLALYQYNIVLCEALYPSLHVFEVVLRNRLEQILKSIFTEQWFTEPRCYALLLDDEKGKLEEGLQKLKEANQDRLKKSEPEKPITSGRVVAELDFGFWTGLLGVSYQQIIWNPYNKRIFPEALPTQREIKTIRVELREIRLLRNRVMHHEPIWQDTRLLEKHTNLCKILSWLSAETALWLAQFNRFPNVFVPTPAPETTRKVAGDV